MNRRLVLPVIPCANEYALASFFIGTSAPRTVKAFLRLIMIKTGASSRSTIVRKIIMTQQQ